MYIFCSTLSLIPVLELVSILRFIQSYGIKGYDYPMGSEYFFEKGEYKKENVDKVRNLSEKEFNDRLFRGYLRSIKSAEKNNDSKADSIKKGQKFLTYALIARRLNVAKKQQQDLDFKEKRRLR
jgi:hypothetical protein